MSCSFLSPLAAAIRRKRRLATGLTLVLLPASGMAADVLYLPVAEFVVETNTNRDLSTVAGTEDDSNGYIADLSLRVDTRTQRSETVIRPRVRLQEYPDSEAVQNIEAYLDLRSQYRWERSRFEVLGWYSHLDLTNAEFADAGFNDVNPEDPTTPESGRSQSGETRDLFRILPSFSYDLSPIWALGADVLYETAKYDSEAAFANVDYDYVEAGLSAKWTTGPRTDLRFRPYLSRYEAQDDRTQVDAYGLAVELDHRWTENYRTQLSLVYEYNEAEYGEPLPATEDDSAVGGLLTLIKQQQVSSWRLVAGRSFTPSSDGYKTLVDQFRVQYDRNLSERLSLTAAARYTHEKPLADRAENLRERDYFRGELSANYRLTPNWFVAGGYHYTWQDYQLDDNDADNSSFFISGGYRGLGTRL